MPKCFVNNKEVEFQKGMTVLQACELAGEEIPRFCYHERLKIAGNCRMCLVQIEGGPPKPAASCAMPAAENMKIHTNTPMVKKAREGVLEFLLINHPLDCPICDQGGECDLQDQTMAYGLGTNRFIENKRAVKDKYMGPLVKTFMTRCIHCTRCIRFLDDVAGTSEMGATGRGEDMEVGTFIGKSITSELSGNIIDLCPVGALTSRPYAFQARVWELRKIETIDVMDAVGSNIRVDCRGNEVMRVLPRINEDINEEWISDKTRFSYDGLKYQRLDRPYIRKNGKLAPASWEEAIALTSEKLLATSGEKTAAIVGDLADAESILLLKELMLAVQSPHIDCRQDGAKLDAENGSSYLFNTTIAGIENADACLLIGTNPRLEATIVNARIKKRHSRGNFPVASIGPAINLTYKFNNLGDNPEVIGEILTGKHEFSKVLSAAKNPMIIVGASAFTRKDGAAILHQISELCKKYGVVKEGWNGFNVIHTAASRVAGLDLGFVPQKGGSDVEEILEKTESGEIEVVYLLGADEIDMNRLSKAFVIYQGHHGDAGAHRADVIFPGAAYTEKNATYVNLEGRVQRTNLAAFPPGEAREDWKILDELFIKMGFGDLYNSIESVRKRMEKIAPHFAKINQIEPAKWQEFGQKGNIFGEPMVETIENYYMTNSICRASKTMAKCTAELLNGKKKEAA